MENVLVNLPCELSPGEIDAKSREVVGLVNEQHVLEDQKRTELNRFNKLIKPVTKKIRVLTGEVKAGAEHRDVECEQTVDGSQAILTRKDTGERVEERTATDDDKQDDLFDS